MWEIPASWYAAATMLELLTWFALIFVPIHDADAVRQTAPTYLTVESAREHIAAATIAGVATGIDPDVLLSIAWHESRYDYTVKTREPGSRCTLQSGHLCYSCGVMTPEPWPLGDECSRAMSSAVEGYLAGAQHLRGWMQACRGSLGCALRGYGGNAAGVFLWRARWITRMRRLAHQTPVML